MTLVLAAHGTRDPDGASVIYSLAGQVRLLLPDVDVHVAFADVRAPDVTTILRQVDGPAVVVPAFLAAGYHVRVDIPEQVARSGNPHVLIAEPFGPAPELVAVVRARLTEAGRRDESVVLAAAGSSDPRALADVRRAASLLGPNVRIGYITTARPRIADIARGHAIASWLLAPGLFHRVLRECDAAMVSEPIGLHPHVAGLVARRYLETRAWHARVNLPLLG